MSLLVGLRSWVGTGVGFRAGTFPTVTDARSHRTHEAGGTGRRLRAWTPTSGGPNITATADAATLRRRSRDLARNNPWAVGGIEAQVANLVGTGVQPRSQAPDPALRTAINQLFLDWTDEADAMGVLDFYGLQALAVRSMIESGEVFGRLRPRLASDGLSVPLQIQLLEADHVQTEYTETLPTGGVIRNGIEFDAIGRKVAIWMLREHPAEYQTLVGNTGMPVRVPAEQTLHLFRPLRPGQVRGTCWLAPAMLRLHELDEYDDAELARKNGAARLGGFITSPNPDDRPILGEEDDPDAQTTSVSFEPGTWGILRPGESVENSLPADVGPNFAAFAMHQLRAIAKGMGGVTYEQLTGDLTGVNYSSYRAGAIEARRFYLAIIHSLVAFQFGRALWQPWMDAAVLAGALPIAASEYLANRRAYQRVVWVPQGWDYVDPLKEVDADIKRVRAGFSSRSAVIQEAGDDPEQVEKEVAEENARADVAVFADKTPVVGAFDSDARKSVSSAATGARGSGTDVPSQPSDVVNG